MTSLGDTEDNQLYTPSDRMKKASKPPDDLIITLSLHGSEKDGMKVRVSDLARFLECAEDVLLATERCLLGKRPALTYLVDGLQEGSAVCSMSAKKPKKGADHRREVVSAVRSSIRTLQTGEGRLNPNLDRDALQKFKKLGEVLSPRSESRARKRVVVDGTEITSKFLYAVEDALAIKEISVGSVSGVLEKIDVHGKNQFAIYPATSKNQVLCAFPDEMLSKVQAALKYVVTVYGTAHYANEGVFPVRIEVTDIELHERKEGVGRLSSMIGRLSQVPGDSVSLVRKVRDEWRD